MTDINTSGITPDIQKKIAMAKETVTNKVDQLNALLGVK